MSTKTSKQTIVVFLGPNKESHRHSRSSTRQVTVETAPSPKYLECADDYPRPKSACGRYPIPPVSVDDYPQPTTTHDRYLRPLECTDDYPRPKSECDATKDPQ